MMITKSRFQFRERFFFLLILPLAYSIEWGFAATHDWQAYPRSEWVMLIDLCLFMPLVYYAFFSSALEIKPRLIRSLGVAGFGLLAARFIVPEANQFFISDLSQLRNALLAVVILFEAWVFYKIIRSVWIENADAKSLKRDFAMPTWIANLMILEARFWKAVWSFFKRK